MTKNDRHVVNVHKLHRNKTNVNLISLIYPTETIIMMHNQGPANNKMTLKWKIPICFRYFWPNMKRWGERIRPREKRSAINEHRVLTCPATSTFVCYCFSNPSSVSNRQYWFSSLKQHRFIREIMPERYDSLLIDIKWLLWPWHRNWMEIFVRHFYASLIKSKVLLLIVNNNFYFLSLGFRALKNKILQRKYDEWKDEVQ